MFIGSIKEENQHETRVAITPSIVKKLINDGHIVILEKEYGIKAGFSDIEYINAGAQIIENADNIYIKSQIILQILPPSQNKLNLLNNNQIIIANFQDYSPKDTNAETTLIRLELVPRTSIAQSIDILSSQSTVRGYMGAMFALYHSPIIAPQLMTAATSIKAAEALIIGASVTGLQAASVFKRQGCRVTIMDINEKNRELAKSVGAEFAVSTNQENLNSVLNNKNFVLSAASAPNGTSPQIIKKEQLINLSKGAVIVDTTSQNIEIKENTLKTPHYLFYRNLHIERLAATTASILWANNMYNLLSLIITKHNTLNLTLNYISPMIFTSQTFNSYIPTSPTQQRNIKCIY